MFGGLKHAGSLAVPAIAVVGVFALLMVAAGWTTTRSAYTPAMYPVTMSMVAPKVATVGEEVVFTVKVTNISHKTLPQVKVYEAIDNSLHTAYTLYLKYTIGSLRPGQTDTHVIHDGSPGRMAYYYTTHYLAQVPGLQTTVGAWTQSKLVPQT